MNIPEYLSVTHEITWPEDPNDEPFIESSIELNYLNIHSFRHKRNMSAQSQSDCIRKRF
jgi:hypothetical protein